MKIIENDVYVAYQGNDSAYIAMDECSISEISSGFLIESKNTVFGVNGFFQKASLKTDSQWNIQELKVVVDSVKLEMNASIKEGKLYLQQKQDDANFEKIITLQNDKFFFMYSGALVIPMIWLRRFDFDNYEKVIYQMLPMGFTEVKQLPNTSDKIHNFSLLMYTQNFTEIVKIQTDILGKMLSFHSETNNISIKLI